MEMCNLQDLLVENLKDLYSAETQLLKALPKVAKKVENQQLRDALQMHLKETEGQVQRLEQIFQKFGEKPTGKKCHGMEGLIEETKELIGAATDSATQGAGDVLGRWSVNLTRFFYPSIIPITDDTGGTFRARCGLEQDKHMTQVMDRKSSEKNGRVRLLDLGNVSAEWGVDRLLERAIELRSSDLFLVTNEQHVSVQVRLRGQIEQLCILDADQG